jgi:hypothetical protein
MELENYILYIQTKFQPALLKTLALKMPLPHYLPILCQAPKMWITSRTNQYHKGFHGILL